MKQLIRFILLASLVVALAACVPGPAAIQYTSIPPATATDTPVPTSQPTATQTPTATPEPTLTPTPGNFSGSATLAPDNVTSAVQLTSLDLTYASKIFWSADSQKIGISLENSYRQLDAKTLATTAELSQRVLDVSKDGTLAVAVPGNNQLQVIEVATAKILLDKTMSFQFGFATFSPDAKHIMLQSQETWAGIILDTATGKKTGEVTGFSTAAPVYNVVYGPDGKKAVWQSRATIQVSDIATNSLGPRIEHEDFIGPWILNPALNLIVTATDGTVSGSLVPIIYLWNPQTGVNIAKLLPDGMVNALAINPANDVLAAGEPGNLLFYKLSDHSLIGQIPLQGAQTVTDLSFSPDGKTLAVLVPTDTGTTLSLWGIP